MPTLILYAGLVATGSLVLFGLFLAAVSFRRGELAVTAAAFGSLVVLLGLFFVLFGASLTAKATSDAPHITTLPARQHEWQTQWRPRCAAHSTRTSKASCRQRGRRALDLTPEQAPA